MTMQNNFTYTLVSGDTNGGRFWNSCNQQLDFATHAYEVCLREMIMVVGAWDNVREGGNEITYNAQQSQCVIPAGRYESHDNLIHRINKVLTGKFTFTPFVMETTAEKRTEVIFKPTSNPPVTQVVLPPSLVYTLGIIPRLNSVVPTITKDFKFDITNNEINKNNISLMWMFADFIEESIVGEFLLPILRMIPIDLSPGGGSSGGGASEH